MPKCIICNQLIYNSYKDYLHCTDFNGTEHYNLQVDRYVCDDIDHYYTIFISKFRTELIMLVYNLTEITVDYKDNDMIIIDNSKSSFKMNFKIDNNFILNKDIVDSYISKYNLYKNIQ